MADPGYESDDPHWLPDERYESDPDGRTDFEPSDDSSESDGNGSGGSGSGGSGSGGSGSGGSGSGPNGSGSDGSDDKGIPTATADITASTATASRVHGSGSSGSDAADITASATVRASTAASRVQKLEVLTDLISKNQVDLPEYQSLKRKRDILGNLVDTSASAAAEAETQFAGLTRAGSLHISAFPGLPVDNALAQCYAELAMIRAERAVDCCVRGSAAFRAARLAEFRAAKFGPADLVEAKGKAKQAHTLQLKIGEAAKKAVQAARDSCTLADQSLQSIDNPQWSSDICNSLKACAGANALEAAIEANTMAMEVEALVRCSECRFVSCICLEEMDVMGFGTAQTDSTGPKGKGSKPSIT